MYRLHFLKQFSATLTKLMSWLDSNFDRLISDMRSQCPDAADDWLTVQIIDAAFTAAFEEK